MIIQSLSQPFHIWITVVSVPLPVPYVRDARQGGEDSVSQPVAKDCDLSNKDDFYSLKIRAYCFLVLIRNSQDAAAFFFFFLISDSDLITLKFSIEKHATMRL